jgi:hypothetical protein
VHLIVGVDPGDNLYILDLWRKQTTSDVWVEAFLDLADQHKPMGWAEEEGQILKSLAPFIEKRSNERRIYFYREQFVSAADKPARCRSFQARAGEGFRLRRCARNDRKPPLAKRVVRGTSRRAWLTAPG